MNRLDGLEAIEKAATPGLLEIDQRNGDILTRGDRGCRSLLCYARIPMRGMEAQFRNMADRDLLIALRNSAPDLLAVARAAIELIEDIDNATGPDEWSTSDLRAALDRLMKGDLL